MISNLEHTALEFLKHSTSSLKALIIFGGIVYMFSTGYCIQLQLVGSFSFFYPLLCTMPQMQRPRSVVQLVGGLCPGWSPDRSATSENVSQPPPPTEDESGFYVSRTMPASHNPCVWQVLYPLSVPAIQSDSLKPMKVLVKCGSCILGK